jgi:amino acid adenylation domain-containing protein
MSFDFNERFPHHSVEGLTFSTYRQYACLDRYKVKLSVCSGGGSIALEFHYDSTLYGIDEIERLAGQYLTLIENVVQRPRSFVSELEILSEAERRRLLVEFNNTRVDYVHGEFVHQLFEQQTVNRPESIAVVCEGSHLSYAQLNGRANQVAHHLQMLGVGPESLVAIYTERSLEMIIGIVGVLKAGGGYVPLDPASPRPRLSLMLENTQPLALLTQQKLLGDLTNGKTRIVYLDAEWEAISQQSAENPISRVMAENTAYVIFTSGSSGEPKGVEIQHGGVLNLLAWHLDSYRVTETDRTSQVANPAFDASVWEIWPSLSAGASLYLADRKVYGSAADLLQWLRNEGITISFLPTALAAVLLSELRQEGLALRVLLTGGDKLSQGASTESPFRLINHYGPTEGTVVATAGLVREGNYTAPPPIGRPIANMQVYLLDAGLDAVPIGVAGDLYIAGDGLARGYLNRPEQTAERFIPNLYSDREGARLYQTGDVAQYLTGGEIEFLGRADHQVQIRGYRIELGEIEAVLRGHPAVKESVALALENEPGEKRLVAYVVTDLGYQSLDGGWGSEGVNPIPTGGDNSLESELKSYIREKLPDYMTPTAIIELNRMPMTPNGKIDRRALPTPIPMRKLGEDEATRTPVEEIIAGIWAEVLKLDRVGVNENFFDLGGHSLMATQILSRIRNALGVEVNLRVMLETPTVTALAEAVELGRGTAGRQSPIKPVDRTVTMPLSYAQQRLWFLDQLEPDSSAYNVPMAFSLRGRLKTPALTQVITEVVRRHESLRTSFPTLDKEPAQWIAEPRPVTIPIIDLSMLNREVSRQTAIRLGREEAQRLFDLSKGPVLRVSLLPQRSEEYLILMTMHHIVSDGWSVGILTGELGRLYAAYTQGEPSPLQELKIQYADYALWQRKWLPEEALERQLNYWKQTLDGMPQVLELPTDRPHSARQSYRGAIRGRDLPEPLSREIRDLSRREGATLFMTFLAAFKILLHYHTSQDDIVVGSPIANRVRTEIEPLIGFFVNTLVLRTNLSGNPGFREVLNQVREMCLGAFANQDLPFEQLVQELRPERRANQQPLFRANFVLQNAPTRPLKLKLPGLVISPFAAGFGWSPFDLIMQIVERKAGLNVSLRYNTTLFTPAKITRLCEDYETLLKSIAAHPDAKLEALYEILAAADKQQEVLEEKQLREASLQKYGRSRRKPVYSF